MTRGNQRDLAREKNKKKLEAQKKSQNQTDKDGNKGLTLDQRKARYKNIFDLKFEVKFCKLENSRDAELMRLKQLKKAEAAEGGAGTSK